MRIFFFYPLAVMIIKDLKLFRNAQMNYIIFLFPWYLISERLRADVSKYRPEVYKSEKSKILKKIHKVPLGKLLTQM